MISEHPQVSTAGLPLVAKIVTGSHSMSSLHR
jgi:hypothetical protein